MAARPYQVRLGAGRWRLWQDVGLRSAGFPADRVQAVCDAGLAVPAARSDAGGWNRLIARLWRRLGEVAAEPRFREAVAWQNPGAVVGCLDKVARGEPRNSRGREHEATIVSYLQRYCLKNDTIGFFGPVGWARVDPGTADLSVTPGPALLARRTTYFETWAIDELARAIAGLDGVFCWLTPRAVASDVLVGRVLHRSRGRPVQLSDVEAALLARCDGSRRVADLLDGPGAGATLQRLCELGAVHVDLDGPVQAWPERRLEAELVRIPDPAVRDRALHGLAELNAARVRLAASAGDADAVMAAWASLAEVFHRLTAAAPNRRAGRTYAGRRLCYEDTVRDVGVRVGASVLDALAEPLTLLLDSARWLVAEVGERYRRIFLDLFERECARSRTGPVPVGRLLVMATPDLPTGSVRALPDPVAGVVAEFQRRWSEILAVPDGCRRYQVSSAAIAAPVSRLFPARRVAWSAATQHSPDIMIARPLRHQHVLLVLGELHLAVNSLESRVFVEQHENADRLLAAAEADHAGRRIYLLPRRDSPYLTSRTLPPSALLSPHYTYVAVDRESAAVPGPVLPLADLLVERRDDTLTVISRTGGVELDFMELIGEVLSGAVINAFRPLATAGHRPRITIDSLVLSRETWCFSAAEAGWVFHPNERERYGQALDWAAEHTIPRWAFFRVPAEEKPVAVHFGSPALVNVLAKAVRGAESFSITEMLPVPEQLWLTDEDGRRYTSELRFVAVDHAVPAVV